MELLADIITATYFISLYRAVGRRATGDSYHVNKLPNVLVTAGRAKTTLCKASVGVLRLTVSPMTPTILRDLVESSTVFKTWLALCLITVPTRFLGRCTIRVPGMMVIGSPPIIQLSLVVDVLCLPRFMCEHGARRKASDGTPP